MRIKKKSKIDEALDEHLGELNFFFFGPGHWEPASDCNLQEMQAALDLEASLPRPRGRPPAHRSKDERTLQSKEAFVLVAGELRLFKQRHSLRQVPKKVRDKLIEFAVRMFPKAEEDLIEDHLRRDQRCLPHSEEPVFYQLVPEKFDDGSVGSVIIVCPANERLQGYLKAHPKRSPSV